MKLPKILLNNLLFPEYNVSELDPQKDEHIIIPRILEYGTIPQLHWLIRFYKKRNLKNFINKYGARKLSLRSLNFWLTVFGIKNNSIKTKLKNQFWHY